MLSQGGHAQGRDTSLVGRVDGIVQDSAHNYILVSATLAIYRKDSSLVSYQLSNTSGEFHFKELPLGVPLKIVATYVGYQREVLDLIIPVRTKRVEIKSLNMQRLPKELKGIVVKYKPPLRMNGDTLEFNADAFKLDRNAQVEDLLQNLPGITVWGDGTITVNGKEVKDVLVNGKPFFGGDTRVATQNIPQNAVDKIQVYQQNRNRDNPLDSVMLMNIRLKKGKSFGHFGKVSAGYGAGRRYDADGSINFFSKQTQLGIVGATNNINKRATDIGMLIRNSTFKGAGASVEYSPDFSRSGIDQLDAGGFTFQHDFIPDPDYYKNNRLTSNYFIHTDNYKINRNTQTIISLEDDKTQIKQNNSKNEDANTGQDFSAKYDKHKGNNVYHIGGGFDISRSNSGSSIESNVNSSESGLKSANASNDDIRSKSKHFLIDATYRHNNKSSRRTRSLSNLNIKYFFDAGDSMSKRLIKTTFSSLASPLQDQDVDRRYYNRGHNMQQHLFFSLGDFSSLILPRWLRYVNTTLQNDIYISTQNQTRQVTDKDTAMNKYTNNNYLSGNSRNTTINEIPALSFERNVHKELADRYSKTFSFNFNPQLQIYQQKNTSSHAFQDITQNYYVFIPYVAIRYINKQYGLFLNSYELKFNRSEDYPEIDELTPLVDSVNLYQIKKGNRNLKPEDKNELSLTFRHENYRAENPFNYNINFDAGIIHNYFADSSIIDTLGRQTYSMVNMMGYRYLNGFVSLNKAFNIDRHELQMQITTSLKISKTPSFINSTVDISNTLSSYSSLNLYYTFKNKLAVDLQQFHSFYRSQQSKTKGYSFKSGSQSTMLSASFNCTKRLTIRSNIKYNHTTSYASAANNFTIWNANASYRLFKENNLELKISALDLLHQNTSIINYGSKNMVTYGKVNVLQQYFMFTVSYFPRIFGAKKNVRSTQNGIN